MDRISEILSEMESGIYDFTKNGKCSNCGQCCARFLPVSDAEVLKIHRYIRNKKIREQKHFVPTADPVIDFTCPFRDNAGKKCVIYDVRPAICKDFRCDKPRKKIKADKEMYHGKYRVVDMKIEFFCKKH